MRVGMIVFPGLTQLDLTGPYEVLARLTDVSVSLIAETSAPVRSDTGLRLLPDATFDDAPPLELLFVPGGPGIGDAIENEPLMAFLRARAPRAAYITSVCTGSLVLGAAGLLRGYRATTHWLSMGLLARLGAIPVPERVVFDRNRITGGGVTAGIDFALRLAAELRGEVVARRLQLLLEYDPAPPFSSGSPRWAPRELVAAVVGERQAVQAARTELIARAARRLAERSD
jgi:cyclohexyl-isocyanide hydratase